MNQYERNLSLLTEYFQNGCKENCSQKLGLEVEHFIVVKETGESVSFYGKHGVAELLERMKPCYSHFYYEGERLLGLYNSEYSLSLEPAAQLEISIAPRREISEIRNIYHSFRRQLEPILETWGYELVMLGYQPVSQIQDLSLIPKKRYDYMDAYFKKTGTMGAHMMRGTASTQISVDFFSERDFVRKMRAAYILMPMIKFLTDLFSYIEGKIQEKRMVRTRVLAAGRSPAMWDCPGAISDGFWVCFLCPVFDADAAHLCCGRRKSRFGRRADGGAALGSS